MDLLLPALREALQPLCLRLLETTTPSDCAPAWTTLATGTLPGTHQVFADEDALRYRPPTYSADGFRAGGGSSKARQAPFWVTAAQAGVPVSVLGVPYAYPAQEVEGLRWLTGRGTPDLEFTSGRGLLLSSRAGDRSFEGGSVSRLERRGDLYRGVVPGPRVPGLGSVELEARFEVDRGARAVRFDVHGTEVLLAEGQTSDWVSLEYRFTPELEGRAQVRFTLIEAFNELELYVSPRTVDPELPWLSISHPEGWARQLDAAHGAFHTMGHTDGLAAVEAGLLEPELFGRMLNRDFDQQLAMTLGELDGDARVLVSGFTLVEQAAAAGVPMADVLERVEAALARVQASLRPGDTLLVVSDHGQQPLSRELYLSQVLLQLGSAGHVQGSRVRLHADEDAEALTRALLAFEVDGERPIVAVAPRPGWRFVQVAPGWQIADDTGRVFTRTELSTPSAARAGHAASVPGDTSGLVLLPQPVEGDLHIADIAPTVLFLLGVPAPSHYEGKVLLEETER